jgi:hypothetical protein
MKLKFGKFTYISEEPLEFGKGLRIEFEQDFPSDLYKYYSPSDHNFKSLSKNEFFASHPYQFNDLTDSNPLSYDFTNLTYDNFKKLYALLVKSGHLTEENLQEMYEVDSKIGFKDYRVHFYTLLTQKIGVICLSTNEMHNLMWGYYASDSGFKIKFNTKKLLESINTLNNNNCLFFPINYIENKLHMDINTYGSYVPILIDLSTKVKHWQHENEWRIIIFKNDMNVPHSYITPHVPDNVGSDDRFINYNMTSIEEIVFGINFFNGKLISKSTFISEVENSIEIIKEDAVEFLKFVSKNLKDKTFMSGLLMNSNNTPYPDTIAIERSIEKIEINHIEKNIFSIIRSNPGYLRNFPNNY